MEEIIMMFDGLKKIRKDLQLIDDRKLQLKIIFHIALNLIRVRIIMFSRFKKDRDAIMERIDTNLFRTIQEKYRKIAPNENYTKYVNISDCLKRNLKSAYRLNLHKSKPLNILDFGAGAGYFCFVCNYFGHNVMAMDVGKSPVFDELIQLLGINRKIGAIEAFKKLPKFDTDFDLITAFYVPFNRASNPDEVWRVEEWKFLLEDFANNLLKENGQIFFFLHTENDGKHYDKILLQFFLDYDTRLLGQELYFEDTEKLRLLSRA
jgi:hypothetical protein